MVSKQTTVITISRQMASGGSYIGKVVANRLGFRYLDRDILNKAAELLGVSATDIDILEKRPSGFFENILKSFSAGSPEAAYTPPITRPVYDKELFDIEAKIIKEICEYHDAVVVGRGGCFLLGDRPGVIKVFIHAPLEFREMRLMEVHRYFAADASFNIKDYDERRRKFIRKMTGREWTDAENYHLCIDTSVVGLSMAAEIIIDLATRQKQPG